MLLKGPKAGSDDDKNNSISNLLSKNKQVANKKPKNFKNTIIHDFNKDLKKFKVQDENISKKMKKMVSEPLHDLPWQRYVQEVMIQPEKSKLPELPQLPKAYKKKVEKGLL